VKQKFTVVTNATTSSGNVAIAGASAPRIARSCRRASTAAIAASASSPLASASRNAISSPVAVALQVLG
jgi:hypothetical protein